jgi:hypothetical protein
LKVEFDKPTYDAEHNHTKIPFRIVIPPNSPLGSHIGDSNGKKGMVNISLGLPDFPNMLVFVRFTIN